MQDILPVSYTHLDVYKRQRYHTASTVSTCLRLNLPRSPLLLEPERVGLDFCQLTLTGEAYVIAARRKVSFVRNTQTVVHESVPRAFYRVSVTWTLNFQGQSNRRPRYFTDLVHCMVFSSKKRDCRLEYGSRIKQMGMLIIMRHFQQYVQLALNHCSRFVVIL